MKLKIDGCNDKNFILYLINYIKNYILVYTDLSKVYYLNIYIDSLYSSSVNCRTIIYTGASNLVFKKFGEDSYIISINENIKFIGLDAKLIDLCKLINYGTVNIKGYPIFTEAFNYIEDHIEILYEKYKRGF